MPLSHVGQERSQRQNLVLALVLAVVAGSVNAIGLIELGETTSHLTGSATQMGTLLARSQWQWARFSAGLLLSFLIGAMLATAFLERARIIKGQARYAAALLLEVFVLTGFTLACELVAPRPVWLVAPLAWSLCLAMGLQNALVTKISHAVVRTTHVTGIVTDLGIELVRLAVWFRKRVLHPRAWTALASDPELHKVRLHSTILLSFITGATLGTMSVERFGHLAMLGPVAVLLALVVYDRVLWLHVFDLPKRPVAQDGTKRAA